MFSKSPSLIPQDIQQTLATISDPFASDRSVIDTGLIENVTINAGQVTISLRVPSEALNQTTLEAYELLRQKIYQAVSQHPHVKKTFVVMTNHTSQKIQGEKITPPSNEKLILPHIKHIIAVASGKGGVGKSLVSLNLALALKQKGLQVGLLDADIYGPSLAKMLNSSTKPDVDDQRKITPVRKFGLQCMSMGFFMAEETPVIWRGPMIQTSLLQFVRDVTWQKLDVLLIDLPPGTGDVQLTLVQKISLSGAIIVSTPQDLALLDARRALVMFRKLNIEILGLIENMSYFTCPNCQHTSDIFHTGGARDDANKFAVPFLGAIPLIVDLRKSADQGEPFVETHPHHEITQKFLEMADRISRQIKTSEKDEIVSL